MSPELTALVDEYEAFCRKEGLPHVSADEHELERLAPEHREWILDFVRRWDETIEADLLRGVNHGGER